MTDTGSKVIHIGEKTTSEIISKSLSSKGGHAIYRGLIEIKPSARGSAARADCDGLILDPESKSDTIPTIRVAAPSAHIAQEATTGRISEAALFYLESRGILEEEAKTMIVNGFLSPVLSALPLEYAAEMNVLVAMELEGNAG